MRKWRENEEIKRKWREYEEIERKWRVRIWSTFCRKCRKNLNILAMRK